ncbi:hypothetical protein TNCV_2745011 [Trichonephila clavipes]|nr:hypothetical protein TNCV_2745011 [Trichonephila clavipes]
MSMIFFNHMCFHSRNGSQEPFFQQDDAQPHTARVSQDYFCIVTTLPWPARSLDLERHIMSKTEELLSMGCLNLNLGQLRRLTAELTFHFTNTHTAPREDLDPSQI